MAHIRRRQAGRRSGTMGLRCKRCGAEEHVKNGFMKGLQRHRCKGCGLNFTDTPPRGMPCGGVSVKLSPQALQR